MRRTLSHKLIGYALGRTVQASDQPLIDRMVASRRRCRHSRRLVAEIVTSRQFRNRVGREDAVPAKTAAATQARAAVQPVPNILREGR